MITLIVTELNCSYILYTWSKDVVLQLIKHFNWIRWICFEHIKSTRGGDVVTSYGSVLNVFVLVRVPLNSETGSLFPVSSTSVPLKISKVFNSSKHWNCLPFKMNK